MRFFVFSLVRLICLKCKSGLVRFKFILLVWLLSRIFWLLLLWKFLLSFMRSCVDLLRRSRRIVLRIRFLCVCWILGWLLIFEVLVLLWSCLWLSVRFLLNRRRRMRRSVGLFWSLNFFRSLLIILLVRVEVIFGNFVISLMLIFRLMMGRFSLRVLRLRLRLLEFIFLFLVVSFRMRLFMFWRLSLSFIVSLLVFRVFRLIVFRFVIRLLLIFFVLLSLLRMMNLLWIWVMLGSIVVNRFLMRLLLEVLSVELMRFVMRFFCCCSILRIFFLLILLFFSRSSFFFWLDLEELCWSSFVSLVVLGLIFLVLRKMLMLRLRFRLRVLRFRLLLLRRFFRRRRLCLMIL